MGLVQQSAPDIFSKYTAILVFIYKMLDQPGAKAPGPIMRPHTHNAICAMAVFSLLEQDIDTVFRHTAFIKRKALPWQGITKPVQPVTHVCHWVLSPYSLLGLTRRIHKKPSTAARPAATPPYQGERGPYTSLSQPPVTGLMPAAIGQLKPYRLM